MTLEPIPWEGPMTLESDVPEPDPDKPQRWFVRPYGDAQLTIIKDASESPNEPYLWEVYVLGDLRGGSSCSTFPLAQAYARRALAECARELLHITGYVEVT